jgi:hypothetical protein
MTSTNTNYSQWLVERYGSIAAVDAAHDDFEVSCTDYGAWCLAVCEEAGIPYSGWTGNVLACARQRLQNNPADHATVQALNDFHNRAPQSALDHWLTHLAGFESAYS